MQNWLPDGFHRGQTVHWYSFLHDVLHQSCLLIHIVTRRPYFHPLKIIHLTIRRLNKMQMQNPKILFEQKSADRAIRKLANTFTYLEHYLKTKPHVRTGPLYSRGARTRDRPVSSSFFSRRHVSQKSRLSSTR